MKFNFKVQQYQTDAVESIVGVFKGQPYVEAVNYKKNKNGHFYSQMSFNEYASTKQIKVFSNDIDENGFRNEKIVLSDMELLANIREIQNNNNVKLSDKLVKHLGRCSLDVEMETGTGKTYVYIKTMYELNKHYGWSKFIVVVPSIAIREGVKKSFEMTQDHFMEQYGKKIRFFIYNSSHLNQLDAFSNDSGICVMIINMQAFNTSLKEGGKSREARIIYGKRDEFGSRRPIDVIKANHPILILDEPQKMGGDVTKKALQNFEPLFCLNYSATHKEHHNLVYALDAVDAYNQRLVKRIEVKGFQIKNFRGTDSYFYLESIIVSPKYPPKARIEYEKSYNNSINHEMKIVKAGDDFYKLSNEMEQYKGYCVSEIDPITSTVTFSNGVSIRKGEVVGDISEKDMRRVQIRETIISHMEKEEELYDKGIKTLSLFFIDEVAKYRKYDENGEQILGEYGKIFEDEYRDVVKGYFEEKDTPYQRYLKSIDVGNTHKGYFSIDKRGRVVNSSIKRGTDISDDVSAYDLILKNKEQLLSFSEPTRFVFSHSALREGWDNPNVFQICTLKHSDSSTMKRQEVGRGLRLCVNQDGYRMDEQNLGKDMVHKINKLTVIASESYRDFVSDLQNQTKQVLYERPTKASKEYFIGKSVRINGAVQKISEKQATMIYRYLIKQDYIDENENITKQYYLDLENRTLALIDYELQPMAEEIHKLIQNIYNDCMLENLISDGNETTIYANELNDNFAKKEFQALWKAINHKYAYTVDFDSGELIKKAIEQINHELFVSQLQYTVSKSVQREIMDANMVRENNVFYGAKSSTITLNHSQTSMVKYDLVGKISEGTVLTRRTVASILQGIYPNKFDMFRNNPEEFIRKVIRIIKDQKASMIVEHVSYNQLEEKYDVSIFTAEKHASFDKAYRAEKHIQDYVFTDGTAQKSVERKFAESLDEAEEVSVYAKLPKGFTIPTPVGNYSPDWAIAFYEGTVKHIYFIAETKGSMESLQLRPIEKAKICCAKKLFNEISTENVVYHDVDNYQKLLDIMDHIDKKHRI